MRITYLQWLGLTLPVVLIGVVGWSVSTGCGGGAGGPYDTFFGSPFTTFSGSTSTTTGPGSTGTTSGSDIPGTGSGTNDPCAETQSRKFVRISMRNLSSDYVHYFLIMIAYVNGDTYPNGAVCPDDVQLYTQNGYSQVNEGAQRTIGNFCITGPALIYYHQNGQFRRASGTGSVSNLLGSAIGPAQGSAPTYDNFFTSGGASLPVPDEIIFHNPGTGEGAALKVALNLLDPCATDGVQFATPPCQQDAFYYVDEDDRLVGSSALGFGSGIRTPDEIQGTGCGCGIGTEPAMVLAASTLSASDVSDNGGLCNAFLRGGRIQFAFVREDTDPPFPQLVWQVTDASGSQAHQFDPRANIN